MKPEYAKWIADYLGTIASPLGRCREASEAMKAAFPELTIVRGHASTNWGERGHWWLVDAAGGVVDPTASQFQAIFEYVPWAPGDLVRIGRCMNCGDDIWEPMQSLDVAPPHKSMCGDACYRSYASWCTP